MSLSSIDHSIESLVKDAIKLTMDLKECEVESDNLIYQSAKLNKDNENIKEYSEDMNMLSNTSIKQPRKALIASIQCENRKLKQLEAENLELKSTLQDYELVMKLMSQKYRNHISKLISHMNTENKLIDSNNAINLKERQKIYDQSKKIEDLTAFIHQIMNLDVQNFLNIQKSLTNLELENEGLRQILNIAKEHNNLKLTKLTSDVGVQTMDNGNFQIDNNVDRSLTETMNSFNNLNISIDISSELNCTKKDLNEFNHKSIKDEKPFDQINNCATIKKVNSKDDAIKINSSVNLSKNGQTKS